MAEFESTFAKGQSTEETVARILRDSGCTILAAGLKTPYAQIDLLVRSVDGELLIVEVKSSDWPDGEWLGFSVRQRRRLERARQWLESVRGETVGFRLISPDGSYFDESELIG